ncbi:MAG: protein kinase domain-containing protein [Anaerolineales bacterium]
MEAGESFALGSQVGRYTLEAVVGQGGMGVVYRAFDGDLLRRVALKVMTPHLTSATALGRFQREAAAVAQLRHPGIAAVFDFGRHATQPYIVFEWIEGRGLNIMLEEAKQLALDRALRLAAQLGSALDYAHQRGILHRDLKPSNVLLTPDDTPIIIDFGLAWLASENTLTMPGALFGTPRYMAPEQFRGEKLDARADLYSLAVMVYEFLAGRPPFLGETIESLYHQHLYTPPPDITTFNPDVPETITMALSRALAKDAAIRFVSGAAFSAALRSAPAPPELKGADTMAVTVPVMLVPSTRPPQNRGTLTSALTVTETAAGPKLSQPRTKRWLMGLVAGLMATFCLVWSVALALLWPRAAPPTLTRPPTNVIAIAQPTPMAEAQSADFTATSPPPSPTASTSSTRATTQPFVIVTVVVTNVVINITATSPPTSSLTITATPSRTPTTAPGQPSNTPPLTATPTSFPSTTNTILSTATASNTPPPTATRTAIIAPTNTLPPPTSTNTLAPTPTNTASVTATPTVSCAITGGALTVSGNALNWSLQNAGLVAATLASLDVNWPDVPNSQRFDRAFFDSVVIADDKDNQPPSAIPAEIAWRGTAADRQLGAGQTRTLQVEFSRNLPATGLSVSATFDNGCTLNGSN